MQKRILFAHFQNLEGKMKFKYWQFHFFYFSNMLSALMINDVPFCFVFLFVMEKLDDKLWWHGKCKTEHVYLDCPIYLSAGIQETQSSLPKYYYILMIIQVRKKNVSSCRYSLRHGAYPRKILIQMPKQSSTWLNLHHTLGSTFLNMLNTKKASVNFKRKCFHRFCIW